jgi:RNA polymerase sigma factor (sigma-70 family)
MQLLRSAASVNGSTISDRDLLGRFVEKNDQSAFTALVRRHTGMVFGVCRRVLPNLQDAEDACQATFLVLAQKAKGICWRPSVANWLFTTARKVARNARVIAQRRAQRETRAAVPEAVQPLDRLTGRELLAALDEELDRLPPRYREPLVLCYLEGLTRDEAAIRLGVPAATLKIRLERGRKRLSNALTKRDFAFGASLFALATPSPARAASTRLVEAVVAATTGSPPAAVAVLARAVVVNRLLNSSILLLLVGTAALGIGLGSVAFGVASQKHDGKTLAGTEPLPASSPEEKPKTEQRQKKPVPPGSNAEKGMTVQGRVLGTDGKPVIGANLFLCDQAGKSAAPQAATDGEGRFRFTLTATASFNPRFLLAMSDGLGLDWADLRFKGSGDNLTLNLPTDVPVGGKVVDLEGKPVVGVAVRIVELSTTASGKLDEFLKQWTADKEKLATGPAFHLLTERRLWSPETLQQLATAKTGPDGAFRLTGIGRDRGLMLGVRGPGVADHYVRVVTRPDFSPGMVSQGQVALSGPKLAIAVAPSKPIKGTLRDAQTRKPLAGVRVLAYTPDRPIHWWWQPVETVTDTQGRYRLDGLAKTRQIIAFDPGCGAPYMHRFDEVGDTAGFAPTVHDTELRRGVVVRGRVTDRSSGLPVRARVVYAPLLNNPYFTTMPGYANPRTKLTVWIDSREMITGEDGRFHLTAMPGPGGLFVHAVGYDGPFTHPAVAKEDKDPAVYHAGVETFMTLGVGDLFPMSDLHAYRLIRPGLDTIDLAADFALDRGARRRGRLVDPDGRPLSGVRAIGLAPEHGPRSAAPLADSEFIAAALNPARPRRLLFWHDERQLAGTVALRGDEPEPVTVRLQPLAALTGRAILKTNGEPLVGYSVEYAAGEGLGWPGYDKRREREPLLTDKHGRFRIANLPAGVPLDLALVAPKSRFAAVHREKIVLEPGKTKDLGVLRGDPYEP